MKQHVIATCMTVIVGVSICGCSSVGAGGGGSAASLFDKFGGSQNVTSMANDLVHKTISDPRLAGLTGGRNIDPVASSGQVSNQLCSMLGGGCKAPLSESQVASAASKVSPAQSQAISENFQSTLSRYASNSKVRDSVTKAVGNKMPGVLGGLL